MRTTRLIITALAAIVIGCGVLAACTKSAPLTKEQCISQGYEWEESADGAECDTGDGGHKVNVWHGSTAPKLTTRKTDPPRRAAISSKKSSSSSRRK